MPGGSSPAAALSHQAEPGQGRHHGPSESAGSSPQPASAITTRRKGPARGVWLPREFSGAWQAIPGREDGTDTHARNRALHARGRMRISPRAPVWRGAGPRQPRSSWSWAEPGSKPSRYPGHEESPVQLSAWMQRSGTGTTPPSPLERASGAGVFVPDEVLKPQSKPTSWEFSFPCDLTCLREIC